MIPFACSLLFGSVIRSLIPSITTKSGLYMLIQALSTSFLISAVNSLSIWIMTNSLFELVGSLAIRCKRRPILATCPSACSVSIQRSFPVPLGFSSPMHPVSFRNAPAMPVHKKLLRLPGNPMTKEKFPLVHTGNDSFDTRACGSGIFLDKSNRVFLIISMISGEISKVGVCAS